MEQGSWQCGGAGENVSGEFYIEKDISVINGKSIYGGRNYFLNVAVVIKITVKI